MQLQSDSTRINYIWIDRVGGVNHCSLHCCRLAKARGLMIRVKYGAMIGSKKTHSLKICKRAHAKKRISRPIMAPYLSLIIKPRKFAKRQSTVRQCKLQWLTPPNRRSHFIYKAWSLDQLRTLYSYTRTCIAKWVTSCRLQRPRGLHVCVFACLRVCVFACLRASFWQLCGLRYCRVFGRRHGCWENWPAALAKLHRRSTLPNSPNHSVISITLPSDPDPNLFTPNPTRLKPCAASINALSPEN
jgi:hypothetical protein